MLETCLLLASQLNQMAAGLRSAPQVEHALTAAGPHHVADPDGLLGLDPLAGSPLRLALSRIEHGALGQQPHWLLLAPEPGRLGGLRGPAEFTAAALEAGAAVVLHAAGTDHSPIAFVGMRVGPAVQWHLWRAAPVVPPEHPSEAARQFARHIAGAADALAELDQTTGPRPATVHAPRLGGAYLASAQVLLDRAWLIADGCERALAEQHQLLSSHLVLTRERHLRDLAGAARQAICSAASWPNGLS